MLRCSAKEFQPPAQKSWGRVSFPELKSCPRPAQLLCLPPPGGDHTLVRFLDVFAAGWNKPLRRLTRTETACWTLKRSTSWCINSTLTCPAGRSGRCFRSVPLARGFTVLRQCQLRSASVQNHNRVWKLGLKALSFPASQIVSQVLSYSIH